MVVVLPEPFGPRNPNIDPAGISRSTPSRARTLPYDFVSPSQRMAPSVIAPSMVVILTPVKPRGRLRARDRAAVPGDDDPGAIVRAVVEDAADDRADTADLPAPDDLARRAVECPEHPGLLSRSHEVAPDATDGRLEQDGVRAEVGVGAS